MLVLLLNRPDLVVVTLLMQTLPLCASVSVVMLHALRSPSISTLAMKVSSMSLSDCILSKSSVKVNDFVFCIVTHDSCTMELSALGCALTMAGRYFSPML